MCSFTITAVFGLASACGSAGPSTLLDPANPHIATHRTATGSVTADLKPFVPAEPKDWRLMNQDVSPSGGGHGGMTGMAGMSMKGMKGMPGMKDMPGMGGGK